MDRWQHQSDAIAFVQALSPGPQGLGAGLFMDMGTGKTRATLDLLRARGAALTLVITKRKVIEDGIWAREAASAWPDLHVCALDTGTAAKRAGQVAALAANPPRPCLVLLNYESAWRAPLGKALQAIPWDAVALDEAAAIKAASSKVSWWAKSLHDRVPLRLALTGTPMAHSFLDAYGIYRFLDQRVFGSNFTLFKNRYAIQAPTRYGLKVVGINPERAEEFNRKIYSIAFRVEAADVLDLPEKQHIDRYCQLTPAGMAAYREMAETFIAELADGTITAANGAVKMLRLQQIAGGWANDVDGVAREADTSKRELLLDMLEELSEPVAVFGRFRSDLDNIKRATEEAGGAYFEISGRAGEQQAWSSAVDQDRARLLVIGVQIQSGGSGIDLTRTRLCIYYSTGHSLLDYEQSLARVHRPGQTRTVTYYHLLARGTVDVQIRKALEERKALLSWLLSDMDSARAALAGQELPMPEEFIEDVA